jgi:hypothetical protein
MTHAVVFDIDVFEKWMANFARPGQLDFTMAFPAKLGGNISRPWTARAERLGGATATGKSRGGRPRTLHKKAQVVATLMAKFEAVGAFPAGPRQLPGTAANLFDTFQRIEKNVTGKNAVFSVSLSTFQDWLATAGFGFGKGRAPADEEHHWTALAPRIIGKTSREDFRLI